MQHYAMPQSKADMMLHKVSLVQWWIVIEDAKDWAGDYLSMSSEKELRGVTTYRHNSIGWFWLLPGLRFPGVEAVALFYEQEGLSWVRGLFGFHCRPSVIVTAILSLCCSFSINLLLADFCCLQDIYISPELHDLTKQVRWFLLPVRHRFYGVSMSGCELFLVSYAGSNIRYNLQQEA